MASGGLASCIIRPSAAMMLTREDRLLIVFKMDASIYMSDSSVDN